MAIAESWNTYWEIETYAFWLSSLFTTLVWYNIHITADTAPNHLSISHSVLPSVMNMIPGYLNSMVQSTMFRQRNMPLDQTQEESSLVWWHGLDPLGLARHSLKKLHGAATGQSLCPAGKGIEVGCIASHVAGNGLVAHIHALQNSSLSATSEFMIPVLYIYHY